MSALTVMNGGNTVKTMRRFQTEAEAESFMRRTNQVQVSSRRPRFVVLVDGPEDDYYVMDLADAIEEGFLYRWSV